MPPTSGTSAKRSRASKPKVKTGCKTCKIRRVKCDETKPNCTRCVKSGFKCDGYIQDRYSPDLSSLSPTIYTPLVQNSQPYRTPSPLPFKSNEPQQQYFPIYCPPPNPQLSQHYCSDACINSEACPLNNASGSSHHAAVAFNTVPSQGMKSVNELYAQVSTPFPSSYQPQATTELHTVQYAPHPSHPTMYPETQITYQPPTEDSPF